MYITIHGMLNTIPKSWLISFLDKIMDNWQKTQIRKQFLEKAKLTHCIRTLPADFVKNNIPSRDKYENIVSIFLN